MSLQPLESNSKVYKHKGMFQVQLEVPENSTLTNNDIEKILAISSWEGGDINSKIKSFEGGRTVKISKDKISYSNGLEQKTLEINGVGYIPLKRIDNTRDVYEQGSKMEPPSTDNFYDLYRKDQLITSRVENGTIVAERRDYAPCGAYIEDDWKIKIKNTQKANSLGLTVFALPKMEAYGRYIDLVHDDKNLGFMVFSSPRIDLNRYTQYVIQNELNSTIKSFLDNSSLAGRILGKGVRELHETGYVHRQIHFSNFYYIKDEGRIQLMDWTTMVPIGGTVRDISLQRAIDLRIPHQSFERIINSIFKEIPKEHISRMSIEFVNATIRSYFNDESLDIFKHFDKLQEVTRKANLGDEEALTDLMQNEIFGYSKIDFGGKVGRNEPCPCGSGKKYKKCCI